MRRLFFLLAFLSVPTVVLAQTPPCTVPSPQTTPPTFTCISGFARQASFDYSGLQPGDVFRLYVNTAQVGADIPAINGTVQIQFGSTLAPGTYAVAVAAFRASAPPEVRSTPVSLVIIAGAPNPPANLRIVEVTIRVFDVAGNLQFEHTETTSLKAQ